MRVRDIYAWNAGPLVNYHLSLFDAWTNETEYRVLLSGPNGCGKTTVLAIVAELWAAWSEWLRSERIKIKPLSDKFPILNSASSAAIILDSFENDKWMFEQGVVDEGFAIGLFFGANTQFAELQSKHSKVVWFGETRQGNSSELIVQSPSNEKANVISKSASYVLHRSAMDDAMVGNVVYFDAENRKWLAPSKNIGKYGSKSDDNWLVKYNPSNDWLDSIEAGLKDLKLSNQADFDKLRIHINSFFSGKVLSENIDDSFGNRFVVDLANGKKHNIDNLSSGERQVLLILYFVFCKAHLGAVVLIDEPDLFLHPSLVTSLLGTLEKLVHERNGQLIIASHSSDAWNKYDNLGKRVRMGVDDAQV
ncbi:MAG: ATP-binding protein [Bacillota bacterium]